MRAQIRAKILEGKTEEQILTSLVAVYGKKVLAAPPKHGFFLSVWVLPFFGLFLGGAFLLAYLRRWTKSASLETTPASPDIDSKLKPYLEQFDE